MFEFNDGPVDGHDWPALVGRRNFLGHLRTGRAGRCDRPLGSAEAWPLEWESLLPPAIELAERGLEVTWVLLVEIAAGLTEIESHPPLGAIVLPRQRLPTARGRRSGGASQSAGTGRDAAPDRASGTRPDRCHERAAALPHLTVIFPGPRSPLWPQRLDESPKQLVERRGILPEAGMRHHLTYRRARRICR